MIKNNGILTLNWRGLTRWRCCLVLSDQYLIDVRHLILKAQESLPSRYDQTSSTGHLNHAAK